MEQLANASVKCVVIESNKELLKQALSTKYGVDYALWQGNELCFVWFYPKVLYVSKFEIRLTVWELPDFSGYYVTVFGGQTEAERNRTIRNTCIALAAALIPTFIFAVMLQTIVFWVIGAAVGLFIGFMTNEYRRIKGDMRNVVNQALFMFQNMVAAQAQGQYPYQYPYPR